jgi:hypothetical protein
MNGIFYCPNCKEPCIQEGDIYFNCVNEECYLSSFKLEYQKAVIKKKKSKTKIERYDDILKENKALYKHIELLQEYLVKFVKLESKIHKLNKKYYHEKDGHPLISEIDKLSKELGEKRKIE